MLKLVTDMLFQRILCFELIAKKNADWFELVRDGIKITS